MRGEDRGVLVRGKSRGGRGKDRGMRGEPRGVREGMALLTQWCTKLPHLVNSLPPSFKFCGHVRFW